MKKHILRWGATVAVAVSLLSGVWWYLTLDSADATAESTKRVRRTVSFSYDWDTSNATATVYAVPQGYQLLVTDVCAYWWGSGPAQRVYIYQDSELKGSFFASGRGVDASTHLSTGASCWSSSQSGLVFESGSSVKAVPSTTYLSVTMAGVLQR